jgi:hypothetical protein
MKKSFIIICYIALSFTICAFRCKPVLPGCENSILIPAKLDSMVARIFVPFDPNTTIQNPNIKVKDLNVEASFFLSRKDTANGFRNCEQFVLEDQLIDLNIFTIKALNINYPANTNITSLFRKLNQSYTIDKPYYISVQDAVKEFTPTGFNGISLLLVEPITIAPNTEFQVLIKADFRLPDGSIKSIQKISNVANII